MLVSIGKSSDAVDRKAFNTQCAQLYEAAAWIFRDKAVSEFQTTWNKCVRRLFNLPYKLILDFFHIFWRIVQ